MDDYNDSSPDPAWYERVGDWWYDHSQLIFFACLGVVIVLTIMAV